jgi:hypothetical protein
MVAIDSETEAVLGLLDAQIWTRDDETEVPRRQRAIEFDLKPHCEQHDGEWHHGTIGL